MSHRYNTFASTEFFCLDLSIRDDDTDKNGIVHHLSIIIFWTVPLRIQPLSEIQNLHRVGIIANVINVNNNNSRFFFFVWLLLYAVICNCVLLQNKINTLQYD